MWREKDIFQLLRSANNIALSLEKVETLLKEIKEQKSKGNVIKLEALDAKSFNKLIKKSGLDLSRIRKLERR